MACEAPSEPVATAAPPPDEGEDEPWEESDTDLDETVKKLMNKTSNMLK